jgi:hypothetical protein
MNNYKYSRYILQTIPKEGTQMSNNNKKIEAGRRSARNKIHPEQNNVEHKNNPTVKRVN